MALLLFSLALLAQFWDTPQRMAVAWGLAVVWLLARGGATVKQSLLPAAGAADGELVNRGELETALRRSHRQPHHAHPGHRPCWSVSRPSASDCARRVARDQAAAQAAADTGVPADMPWLAKAVLFAREITPASSASATAAMAMAVGAAPPCTLGLECCCLCCYVTAAE